MGRTDIQQRAYPAGYIPYRTMGWQLQRAKGQSGSICLYSPVEDVRRQADS